MKNNNSQASLVDRPSLIKSLNQLLIEITQIDPRRSEAASSLHKRYLALKSVFEQFSRSLNDQSYEGIAELQIFLDFIDTLKVANEVLKDKLSNYIKSHINKSHRTEDNQKILNEKGTIETLILPTLDQYTLALAGFNKSVDLNKTDQNEYLNLECRKFNYITQFLSISRVAQDERLYQTKSKISGNNNRDLNELSRFQLYQCLRPISIFSIFWSKNKLRTTLSRIIQTHVFFERAQSLCHEWNERHTGYFSDASDKFLTNLQKDKIIKCQLNDTDCNNLKELLSDLDSLKERRKTTQMSLSDSSITFQEEMKVIHKDKQEEMKVIHKDKVDTHVSSSALFPRNNAKQTESSATRVGLNITTDVKLAFGVRGS